MIAHVADRWSSVQYRLGLLAILVLCALAAQNVAIADQHTREELEYFEREVRPLLVEHCYSCHSAKAKKLKAGLYVDSRPALLTGGDSGASIVPGDPDASLFIEAVRYDSYEMPPKGKLADEEIATFERWVEMGAPWPEEAAAVTPAGPAKFPLAERAKEHWVWQPLSPPSLPPVSDSHWPKSELDHFILNSLERSNLTPSRDVKPEALLRRLYFDLIGLPPSPEQVSEFLADPSDKAIAAVVDRLLASEHFGERWGRHWLDLMRYAESRGHEFDEDAQNAYQYRDYVIRALNADVPYDQLIREHIAGDLLSEPRLHPDQGFNESILGTGFWFLGEWVHSPVDIRKDESDRFDNMIDVMSKAFLGVTVSCARCHDHKFDAISTKDYYSLTGFLQGSDFRQVRFESIEHNKKLAQQLAEIDAGYQAAIDDLLDKNGLQISSFEPIPPSLQQHLVVDYGQLPSEDFIQDGFLFGPSPRRVGRPFLTTTEGQQQIEFARFGAAVSDPIWDGMRLISEQGIHQRGRLEKLPRSGRTLRTPTFELVDGNVACRVRGKGSIVACVDSHRLVAGPLHGETVKTFKETEGWIELKLDRYVGHRLHLEFTPETDSHLAVIMVTQGVAGKIRKQFDKRLSRIADQVESFQNDVQHQLSDHLNAIALNWSGLREEIKAQIMLQSRLAMAMMDGTGEDAHVLIRGNSSKPGKVEPRHFLTAISGDQPMQIARGSGRRELAAAINDTENPLTKRVIVNRLWHYLMGRGIVPTTDDFGVLGMSPTHPELLDHLAIEFAKDGQSIKSMIRQIVLSRTYRMSSFADAAAVEKDPKNRLWHHRPPKRLDGESIRDSLLKISGRLDPTLFGEPIPVHLTAFMDGRGRPNRNGPLDGAGRRSIYTSIRRNFLSPFMLTFDTPVPFSTMGRRNISNVPAQALILMNDPLVVELARDWAQRALENSDSAKSRIQWLYLSGFGRVPTEQEMTTALRFVTSQGLDKNDRNAWEHLAHALVNTKEFIYLR